MLSPSLEKEISELKRKKEISDCILSRSSELFAISAIAVLTILIYCSIHGAVYGWKRFEDIFLPFPHKVNPYTSALMLSFAAFTVASLTLLISYGIFKYCKRNSIDNKNAGKIINHEVNSVSKAVLLSASTTAVVTLSYALFNAFLNNQEILPAASRVFGFSSDGIWQGGLGGLLFSFLATSLTVFLVSSVVSRFFKEIDGGSRYYSPSLSAYHNSPGRQEALIERYNSIPLPQVKSMGLRKYSSCPDLGSIHTGSFQGKPIPAPRKANANGNDTMQATYTVARRSHHSLPVPSTSVTSTENEKSPGSIDAQAVCPKDNVKTYVNNFAK